MSRSIIVRTQFVGVHCWPDAPAEVGYLKHPHRHIFEVEVRMGVEHNDREVEFHMLKHDVDACLKGLYGSDIWPAQMGSTSCEQVAEDLLRHLKRKYGSWRFISIGVFEDGENGAVVDNGVQP